MTEETQPSKLTPDSPVDADTLKRFEDLQRLRAQLSERCLELERVVAEGGRARAGVRVSE